MRKLEQRLRVGAVAAALSIVAPTLAVAAEPAASRFTTDPHPESFCGVPGTAFETVVEHFKEHANGSINAGFHFTQVFTATSTGKSIEASGTEAEKVTVNDNGDGTITYVVKSSGLALQFKILNGPVLQLAEGRPIRSAGTVTISETVDAATGETLDFTLVAEHGTHLFIEGGADVCGPVIAYLTAP